MNKSIFVSGFASLFFGLCYSVCDGQQKVQTPKSYSGAEGFVTHEWGTFTSLYQSNVIILTGLEREEEHLPQFVNSLCNCYRQQKYGGKGYDYGVNIIKNVTVKMETPVIYFYSGETKREVFVDVKFKGGSVSQWYPDRSGGEPLRNEILWNPTLTSTANSSLEIILNFKNNRKGAISWRAEVLPKSVKVPYTNDPEQETPQWNAPRATQSNLISVGGKVEKFLFYRGIANFHQPIGVSFNNQGNLIITNSGYDPFTYVLVYEKRKNGKVVIWWSGSISGNIKKTVPKPANEDLINPDVEKDKFTSKLVSAGLYTDEAKAMLKTWEKSYFEHEGIKVFWIVPRKFADEILPISIAAEPVPDKASVQRVFIGRSEILTPEFERDITGLSDSTFNLNYKDDRFLLAYQELRTGGIPQAWTDYNTLTLDEPEDLYEDTDIGSLDGGDFKNVEMFPNPVSGDLVVKVHDNCSESILIKLYSSTGELVNVYENIKIGENIINFASIPSGIYSVKLEYDDGQFIVKRIVKD